MGVDHQDSSNLGLQLVLGLALTTSAPSPSTKFISRTRNSETDEPCLSSGLFGDQGYNLPKKKVDIGRHKVYCTHEDPLDLSTQTTSPHSHSHSANSSFSSGCRVKRETDLNREEVEAAERFSSRASDEDEDATNARKKLRLTKQQSALLEEGFKQHTTLNPKQKQALAMELNLRPRQVEVWFQNRRARTKLKQTEVDCEFLKKCCETLTQENRRLQKELQELKSLKLGQPLYVSMPAATLTMCPSCETLGGGASSNITSFTMPTKPHIYNPFTSPSAAC